MTTACFIITSSLPLSNSSDRERQQAIHVSDPSRPPIQNPRPFLSGSIRISSNSSRLAAIDFHRCALLGHVVRVVKNCALNFFSGACKPVRGGHRLLLDASFGGGDTRTHTWPTNFCTTAAGDRTITPPLETDQPGKAKFAKVIVGVCVSLDWMYVCTLNKKKLVFLLFFREPRLSFSRDQLRKPQFSTSLLG